MSASMRDPDRIKALNSVTVIPSCPFQYTGGLP